MQLIFDNIDEVHDFVSKLKKTRTKGDKDEGGEGNAPAPMLTPAGGAMQGFGGGQTGFAPPAGGAGPAGAGPFAAVAPQVAPEVVALVTRIVNYCGVAKQQGQDMTKATEWFRGQLVQAGHVEAAQATLEQITQVFLPRLPVAHLQEICKLTGA